MKTTIIAIARNEDPYIVEWLEYHKGLGFDHVTLFDNNDKPTLGKIVKKAGLDGFCLVDNRYVGVRAFVQQSAFKEEYDRIKNLFDWVLFIDVDEFLVLDGGLHEFLSDPRYDAFDEIRMNWRVYGDSGRLAWSDEPVMERFTEHLPKERTINRQCKSFVRGRIKSPGRISCHGMRGVRACDVHGKPCQCSQPANDGEPIWDTAVVNHYKTKSIGEYLVGKVARGDSWNKYSNSIEVFFNINERTPEKERMVEKFMEVRNGKDASGSDIH